MLERIKLTGAQLIPIQEGEVCAIQIQNPASASLCDQFGMAARNAALIPAMRAQIDLWKDASQWVGATNQPFGSIHIQQNFNFRGAHHQFNDRLQSFLDRNRRRRLGGRPVRLWRSSWKTGAAILAKDIAWAARGSADRAAIVRPGGSNRAFLKRNLHRRRRRRAGNRGKLHAAVLAKHFPRDVEVAAR
jgi:hypothetical protein